MTKRRLIFCSHAVRMKNQWLDFKIRSSNELDLKRKNQIRFYRAYFYKAPDLHRYAYHPYAYDSLYYLMLIYITHSNISWFFTSFSVVINKKYLYLYDTYIYLVCMCVYLWIYINNGYIMKKIYLALFWNEAHGESGKTVRVIRSGGLRCQCHLKHRNGNTMVKKVDRIEGNRKECWEFVETTIEKWPTEVGSGSWDGGRQDLGGVLLRRSYISN